MKIINKIAFVSAVLFLLAGCTGGERAQLLLNIDGAANKEVILSKLSVNRIDVIDTLMTDSKGYVKCEVDVPEDAPEFYYVSYGRKRLASLIAKGGDRISVSVDTLGASLEIAGSDESVLLSEIENEIYGSTAKFDSLAIALSDAMEKDDESLSEKIRLELGSLYVTQKREAIKRLMTNPKSFTNIILLYRRFNDNLALFSDNMDFIYFKTAYDSLSTLYPNSVYVKALKNDADNLHNMMELSNKIAQASELAYPDLELPDAESQMHRLSELQGKPFILLFWTASNAEQKMYNLELKKIYERYAGRGLNIYQVCIDTDKALWASVVKEQNLPWINVCDGLGTSSPALITYAVQRIPAMFIFDSNGDIVEKDKFDINELNRTVARLL